ncbi:MAG: regulatory iron-sulfur-containing complex subunit RicT [Gemmatimonadaceae bacterium]
MAHLIEVAFRGNRKDFFRWDGEAVPSLKSAIIVEADRGEDLGHVHSTGELAEVRCKGCPHGCGTAAPSRVAIRLASATDQLQFAEITAENESARQRAAERVKANGLVMKLTDAEWQWDRKKLTFFFTSDRRVDFRTLVRELASMFRTRIELKQIGVRDEAKRLSGIGRCGREYCSSSWLPDLRPVNLAVAKDQKLSLNPSQISGACGRLMCCLRYEHEFYVESRRRFPKEGRIVRTRVGDEKVLSCNIFHETVTLRTAEGDTRVVSLADFKSEIEAFGGALSISSQSDMDQTPFADERMTSETQEFMVARETMPMIDILVQPSDEITLENAEVLETITVLHDMDPDPAPLVIQTIVTAGPTPSAEPATEQTPASGSEGEVRRKRRRGRRGGRRLRGADGRARDGNNSASTDGQATSSDNDDDGADDDDDSNDSTTN